MSTNNVLAFLNSSSRCVKWLKKPKNVSNSSNINKNRLDSNIRFYENKYQTLTASAYIIYISSIAKQYSDLILLIPDNGIQARLKFYDNSYIIRSLEKGILIAKEKGVCLVVTKHDNIETCFIYSEGEWEVMNKEYIVLTGAPVKLSLNYNYKKWTVKAINSLNFDNHGTVIENYIDMLYDKNEIFIINEILINEDSNWKNPSSNMVPKNELNAAMKKIFESCYIFGTSMLLSVYDLLTRRKKPWLNVYDLQRFNKEWNDIYEVLFEEKTENNNLLMGFLALFVIDLNVTKLCSLNDQMDNFFNKYLDSDDTRNWRMLNNLYWNSLSLKQYGSVWLISRKEFYDREDNGITTMRQWIKWPMSHEPIVIIGETPLKNITIVTLNDNPSFYFNLIMKYKTNTVMS